MGRTVDAIAHPYGAQLRVPASIKLKCLQVVPNVISGGLWSDMWGANFNWVGWLKPQIDVAIALGANSVKVSTPLSTYINGSAPTIATANARIRQFLDYCLNNNLNVYINMAGANDVPSTASLAQIATAYGVVAQLLQGYPNIVGLDLFNEINFNVRGGGATEFTGDLVYVRNWLNAFTPAVRANCDLPLTYSLLVRNTTEWGGGWPETLDGYVDYFDFHPYYASGDPTTADVATYFTAKQYSYKRFLLGECGQPLSAGQVAQTNRWTALGTIAALSSCYGAVGFCIADYNISSTAQRWGIYDQYIFAQRAWLATAFAAWSGRS